MPVRPAWVWRVAGRASYRCQVTSVAVTVAV